MTSTHEILVRSAGLVTQIPRPGDGFPSADEAAHWRPRGCGIACVRMILDTHGIEGDTYWSLVTEGVDAGAYCDRGWIHQGLVDMLSQRGIRGHARRRVSVDDLAGELAQGRLVIASVTANFRGGELRLAPEIGTYPTGGHLVLVTGVSVVDGVVSALRVHHPSATEENNRADHWVDAAPFAASFSGNLMAFDGGAAASDSSDR
ncbi:MAG: C39 family peptidase [Actinomycetota bacterium]